MLKRKPLAPNNRLSGHNRAAFLASLESVAAPINYPKSKEKASVFHYARAGRQNSQGFGGGRMVGK